jgi:hypothetical protein
MIDRKHDLPISKQADALNISRGSVYYLPRPVPKTELAIMHRLDRLHLQYPFAGSRMLRGLLAAEGCKIGRRQRSLILRRINKDAVKLVERAEQIVCHRNGYKDGGAAGGVGGGSADSDECVQLFRSKTDSVLIDCGQHSDDPGQGAFTSTAARGSLTRNWGQALAWRPRRTA